MSGTRCWAMLLTYLNGTASTGVRGPHSSNDTDSWLAENDSERPAQVIAKLARRDHEVLRRSAIRTRAKRQERQPAQRGTSEKMQSSRNNQCGGKRLWGRRRDPENAVDCVCRGNERSSEVRRKACTKPRSRRQKHAARRTATMTSLHSASAGELAAHDHEIVCETMRSSCAGSSFANACAGSCVTACTGSGRFGVRSVAAPRIKRALPCTGPCAGQYLI